MNNNLLPLLLVLLVSSRGAGGYVSEKLSPLLSLLGVSDDALSFFSETGPLSGLIKGDMTADKLLPVIVSLLSKKAFSAENKENPSPSDIDGIKKDAANISAPNYLKPISDIAGDEINYALARYFANA